MIVAGFGFRGAATKDSLRDAFDQTGGVATHLATLEDKARLGAFKAFAKSTGLPVIVVSAEDARAQDTPTQSAASLAAYGTGSVAESTALAAAGRGALLTNKRAISSDTCATCAIAKGPK